MLNMIGIIVGAVLAIAGGVGFNVTHPSQAMFGATTFNVQQGGTGSTTLTGILKGNGTSYIGTAVGDSDYQLPITLTTTGSSGAATFIGDTLNIPQYSSGGNSFDYPFPNDATSTALTFNGGLLSVGSTTINGNATTTGSQYASSLRLGTPLSATYGGIGADFSAASNGVMYWSNALAHPLIATGWSTLTSVLSGQLETTEGGTNQDSSAWNGLAAINSGVWSALSTTSLDASITGNAGTATALAANGSNCSSGQAPLGVDASGAVESCFDVWTEAENTSAAYAAQATTLTVAGTANQITSSAGAQSLAANRTWTLSLPNHVIFPSSFQVGSATTSDATSSVSQYFPFLATAAGTFVAIDPNGKLIATTTPAGGTPGGSDTQVQFNDGGSSFGASNQLTWANHNDGVFNDTELNIANADNSATTSITGGYILGNGTGINIADLNQTDGPLLTVGASDFGLDNQIVLGFLNNSGATLTLGGPNSSDPNVFSISSDGNQNLSVDTSALTTTRTWNISDLTGTPALGSYSTGFLNGSIPFGSSGLLATSSGLSFDASALRLTTTYASTTALSTANINVSGLSVFGGRITATDSNTSFSGAVTPLRYLTLQTGTTTTWTASTTNTAYSPYVTAPFTGTLRQAKCATDSSFLGVNTQVNGSNATPSYFVASTTVGTISYSAGNTFTAGQQILMNFGTTTTSSSKSISCTLTATETP